MKKLNVGQLYVFDYERFHEVQTLKNVQYVQCQLSKKERNNLIKDTLDNKEHIENFFNTQKNDAALQKYFADIKKYNKIVEKRKAEGIHTKSDKELSLLELIESSKSVLFPKQKKVKKANFMARNIFIRYFIPENIAFENYKNIDTDLIVDKAVENNKIVALYSGKHYTVNGLLVYKWYMLNPTNIPDYYITESMKKYLDI